ncbi:hypothetical protein QQ045_027820 [Rhodiola kirilowii]
MIGRPLVLRHWSPDSNFSLERVISLPVWVRFPGLPPHLQRPALLSRLASTLGQPIRTDGFTARNEKLMYARVLVEIFATIEFKKSVVIKGLRGTNFVQKVIYEWTPLSCDHCQCFGHFRQACTILGLQIEAEKDSLDRIVIEPEQKESWEKANHLPIPKPQAITKTHKELVQAIEGASMQVVTVGESSK